MIKTTYDVSGNVGILPQIRACLAQVAEPLDQCLGKTKIQIHVPEICARVSVSLQRNRTTKVAWHSRVRRYIL